MARKKSTGHGMALREKVEELEKNGWRVIDLDGRSPDAIAIKDGKIIAVEILKKFKTERTNEETIKRHGRFVWRYSGGKSQSQKRQNYSMFDDVEFSFWED